MLLPFQTINVLIIIISIHLHLLLYKHDKTMKLSVYFVGAMLLLVDSGVTGKLCAELTSKPKKCKKKIGCFFDKLGGICAIKPACVDVCVVTFCSKNCTSFDKGQCKKASGCNYEKKEKECVFKGGSLSEDSLSEDSLSEDAN